MVDPNTFLFVAHWTEAERVDAAKIVYRRAKSYDKWLGMREAASRAIIGVVVAYKRYGPAFKPNMSTGWIRTELRSAAREKQRYVNVTEHDTKHQEGENAAHKPKIASMIVTMETYDDHRSSLEHIDLLRDIERVVTEEEYEIVCRRVLLDAPLNHPEQRIYKKALAKIRECLYV